MDFDFDLPEDFATDESFINYCFHSDATDVHFWEKWLNDHPEKKKAAAEARELVFLMSIKLEPCLLEDEYAKIKVARPDPAELPAAPAKKFPKIFLGAGIFILLIITAILISQPYFKTGNDYAAKDNSVVSKYATNRAQDSSITLPDGTHIKLNAASSLTIDHDFRHASKREVTLSGEAYFDVAKDAAKPFIIHTQTMDITVLGTTFNVKDYPTDKLGETSLINGSVKVHIRNDSSRTIILKPNEKITVYKKGASLKQLPAITDKQDIARVSPEKFRIAPLQKDPLLTGGTVSTAWMEGKLIFRNEEFDDLAKQMERKYDAQFKFSNSGLKAYRFTGVFSTETMEEALHALQLASPSNPFSYKIEGKKVFISNRE